MMKKLLVSIAILVVFVNVVSFGALSQKQGGDFELTQRLLIVNLKQGETIQKNIGLINNLNTQLSFNLSVLGSDGVVSINQKEVMLEPEEHAQIETIFLSGKTGVNTGKFLIKSPGDTKELPFVSEVWSGETGYIPKVEIPAEFREVKSDSELTFRLSVISNTQTEGSVVVTYQILDFNNKVLSEKTEDFLVKDSISVLRKVSTQSIAPGDHVLGVIVKSGDSVATNTKIFTVQSSDLDVITLLSSNLLYILVTVVIVVIVLMYLNYGKLVLEEKRSRRGIRSVIKHVTKIQKITRVQRITKVIKPRESTELLELSKRRLEKQLASLEAGYKAGYIKKEAYLKGKERLEKLIRSIDKRFKRG
ncbi:MAG: hypothetical protein HY512_00205 [Candidatus Aenigmarchaeota archaeon]|nr:hypothetical protein [Candidatus Aenigmarchaeota archaeon]